MPLQAPKNRRGGVAYARVSESPAEGWRLVEDENIRNTDWTAGRPLPSSLPLTSGDEETQPESATWWNYINLVDLYKLKMQ